MGMNATDAEAPEGAVKYRLVEAEEVSDKPQQAPASGTAKPKRKGKLNWSQFPMEGEDAEAAPQADAPTSTSTRGGHHARGRAPRGGSGGRFGGRRHNGDSNGSYFNGVYVPTPDVKVTAQWAKNQIEFYFTSDNLVRDIFLRQHMDVDGFVPLAFVGSFQAVYSVHQDYASLLEAVKQSETLELDEQNEKIRLREGWQKWVWPNAEGGYGVPRYIKLADKEATPAEE
ncbi:RNA-binding protein LARP/SRO9 [Phytophthora cinnamomi]|uniref:RNA-binding protein LARP/SRO9 n=1 Tax=Phytophthora cinnamomi TaxID=4785 RepID=UPI00355AACA8|nr:RNA-binding protein LARP/SRO9 [Phytophthora cinnamomi]